MSQMQQGGLLMAMPDDKNDKDRQKLCEAGRKLREAHARKVKESAGRPKSPPKLRTK